MFVNYTCICQLLLCSFKIAVFRKFLFRNLSHYRVVCNRIYQFKGTIIQIENQLKNDRSHNFVVIHA